MKKPAQIGGMTIALVCCTIYFRTESAVEAPPEPQTIRWSQERAASSSHQNFLFKSLRKYLLFVAAIGVLVALEDAVGDVREKKRQKQATGHPSKLPPNPFR